MLTLKTLETDLNDAFAAYAASRSAVDLSLLADLWDSTCRRWRGEILRAAEQGLGGLGDFIVLHVGGEVASTAVKTVRVKLSTPAQHDLVNDEIARLGASEQSRVVLRKTYVQGPQDALAEIGQIIADNAEDAADTAAGASDAQSAAEERFAAMTAYVSHMILGNRLQGKLVTRKAAARVFARLPA